MTAVCQTGSGLQTNVDFVGVGGVFLKSIEEHTGWGMGAGFLETIPAVEGDIEWVKLLRLLNMTCAVNNQLLKLQNSRFD